jgi:hypothetical protein
MSQVSGIADASKMEMPDDQRQALPAVKISGGEGGI